MEFLQLRNFVTVADAGSFSRAALRLNLTQPALSRQIRSLEDELGTRLFYRHGRGVSLTEAGRKLRDVAKPMLDQLILVKREIAERAQQPSGTVVLGVPPSIGNTLAAPLALRFREAYPRAALRVREGFSSTLVEWIESGQLDVAVLYDARRDRNLLVSPLLLEDFFLIEFARPMARSSAVSLADIGTVPLVLPGPENGFRKVIDSAAHAAGVTLTIAIEVDSITALKQLVLSGKDVCTILPFGAVHQEVRERRLTARPINSPAMQALLVAATPPHRHVTKAARAVLRLIQLEIKRCVASGILKGHTDALSLRRKARAAGAKGSQKPLSAG